MSRLFVLFLLATVGCTAASFTPFPEFQERFMEHSQLVEPPLQRMRAEHSKMRLEVVHQMIPTIASLTLEMRQHFAETWEMTVNHPNTTEECLVPLRYVFDWYVWGGEVGLMSLAMTMDQYMETDVQNRFVPRVTFMGRENTRAMHQTVQTLGRNVFMDNIGDTAFDLQDALDYHENLWVAYEKVLNEELAAVEQLKEQVQETLDWWYRETMDWKELNRQSFLENIDVYCVD